MCRASLLAITALGFATGLQRGRIRYLRDNCGIWEMSWRTGDLSKGIRRHVCSRGGSSAFSRVADNSQDPNFGSCSSRADKQRVKDSDRRQPGDAVQISRHRVIGPQVNKQLFSE
jgi:hypothetical protein